MTATTAMYLELQRLYRERAEKDVVAVQAHLDAILESVGKSPGAISAATVRHFVKNARNLR